mgnify:CR=1 FL=1
MKKFSLKFMLFVILSLFSSLTYADGVFSRYYNTSYDFSVAVPLEKYEQDTNEGSKISELEFIKKSNIIPSKDYFKGHGALAGDGIAIKNKNGDTSILVYGTYILHDFNAENLAEDKIKELETKLNSVSTNTNVLQETLLIAKQTADEMKKRAEEEASIIVGEAKKMLEDRAGNIDQIIEEKQNTLNFLKNEIETYKAKAERMLIEQLEILKKIEEQQQN